MLIADNDVAASFGISAESFGLLTLTAVALAIGTAIRLVLRKRLPVEQRRGRLSSLVTWWALLGVLAVAVGIGYRGIVVLMAVLSVFGMREYCRLTHATTASAWIWPVLLSVTLGHYGLLLLGQVDAARVVMPLVALVVPLVLAVVFGRADGFLRVTGVPLFGLMLIAYCPSHAALLAAGETGVAAESNQAAGFLYLVLVTEVHDIAQALWGRKFGKRRITPTISPGKTWEGFLLGSITTVCVATLLSSLLTLLAAESPDAGPSWPDLLLAAAGGGLVIAVAGFLGDVSMSGIKRDCGVKDSGHLLPGQGGVLDRIDSLTLSAPAFYYYVLYGPESAAHVLW